MGLLSKIIPWCPYVAMPVTQWVSAVSNMCAVRLTFNNRTVGSICANKLYFAHHFGACQLVLGPRHWIIRWKNCVSYKFAKQNRDPSEIGVLSGRLVRLPVNLLGVDKKDRKYTSTRRPKLLVGCSANLLSSTLLIQKKKKCNNMRQMKWSRKIYILK
jgi:hypothetical protein